MNILVSGLLNTEYTARPFCRKMGYNYKNGIDTVDAEQLYRLEKFR